MGIWIRWNLTSYNFSLSEIQKQFFLIEKSQYDEPNIRVYHEYLVITEYAFLKYKTDADIKEVIRLDVFF